VDGKRMMMLTFGVIMMTIQAQAQHRVIDVAAFCLLNGAEYENADYVLAQLGRCPEAADLVVLPHMPFLSFRTKYPGRDLKPFANFARERRAYLALAMTEMDGEDHYHAAVLLDRRGHIVGRYRKTHALADDEVSLGDTLRSFATDFGRIGMTVTTDFYFPEVYQVLSMKGADILTWHHYPERVRDHSGWEPLLMARCLDSHAHMVTAMYADPRTYITNSYGQGMPGAAWGRSMVLNRVGTPIADTGYEDGIASATVDLDKRKLDVYAPYYQGENIFFVNNLGDRKALAPVAEPYEEPELPEYAKRTCRLAVGYFARSDIWRNETVPETLLRIIDQAAELQPDLLLLSEQSTKIEDDTTQAVMKMIGAKAAQMNCYIAIGGIGDTEQISICRVWDRSGNEIYSQPLYWPKGFAEIKVFDTDFGRVGSHQCGDLYIPEFDRVLALKGAEIIIDPSQMWGASGRTNETMLRARAIDNAVWIACAHWPTSDPSLRSLIIDPYGQVMSSSAFLNEGVIYYDIDLERQRVYYAGMQKEQATPGKTGIPSYYSDKMPEQRLGWREMMLRARRPELYGIIPTVNEVIMRYRPAKAPE
jgi:predicted amidohydrolase